MPYSSVVRTVGTHVVNFSTVVVVLDARDWTTDADQYHRITSTGEITLVGLMESQGIADCSMHLSSDQDSENHYCYCKQEKSSMLLITHATLSSIDPGCGRPTVTDHPPCDSAAAVQISA